MPGVTAEVAAEFERNRLMAGIAVDPTLLRPFADDPKGGSRVALHCPTSRAQARAETVILGTAYERYIHDPTHRWSASTRQAYETSRKLAVSVTGAPLPMA
jgi:hypothetical protein